MRVLTEQEYLQEAKSALRQIFVNENYTGEPFSPQISERRIIYEYHYKLTQPLDDVVFQAISKLKEEGVYWSLIWKLPEEDIQNPNYCYISLSEFTSLYIKEKHKDYNKIRYFAVSENILFSPQGKWGIMFSDEGYALLGGVPEFIEIIEQAFPEINSQVYAFLETLRVDKHMFSNTTNISWLRGLLTHIYGEEEAKKMLRKSGIWGSKRKK